MTWNHRHRVSRYKRGHSCLNFVTSKPTSLLRIWVELVSAQPLSIASARVFRKWVVPVSVWYVCPPSEFNSSSRQTLGCNAMSTKAQGAMTFAALVVKRRNKSMHGMQKIKKGIGVQSFQEEPQIARFRLGRSFLGDILACLLQFQTFPSLSLLYILRDIWGSKQLRLPNKHRTFVVSCLVRALHLSLTQVSAWIRDVYSIFYVTSLATGPLIPCFRPGLSCSKQSFGFLVGLGGVFGGWILELLGCFVTFWGWAVLCLGRASIGRQCFHQSCSCAKVMTVSRSEDCSRESSQLIENYMIC